MINDKQPYIFISYAHKDKELIYPFVKALSKKYGIWLDEGINYSREWEEEIASKLDGCSIFIFAITENSLKSENCRDELSLARDSDKRFLNVLFTDDTTLPGWFKLRYGRYQMCYYNRFESAEAVVEDLPKKCEWFEDVKLLTVNTPTQEEVTDSDSVPSDDSSSSDDVTVQEKNSEETYALDKDSEGNTASDSLFKYDKNALEKYFGVKFPEEISSSTVTEDKTNVSIPAPKRYTREQIIQAVEYANRREMERNNNSGFAKEFLCAEHLVDYKVDNAIRKFAGFTSKRKVVAQCDTTMFGSGKDGVLISETEMYVRYGISYNPISFSNLSKVELVAESQIKFTYNDSSTESIDYSALTLLIYDFLYKLINSPAENNTAKGTEKEKTRRSPHACRFTREDIINSVNYANWKIGGRSGEESANSFVLHHKLSDRRIDNAIKSYANNAPRESVIAMLDMTLLDSGKTGVLVTQYAVYNDYPKGVKPVILSKLNSVEKIDDDNILVVDNDSTTRKVYYGKARLPLVYAFYTRLLEQES
jgi:hypothetical protein